LPVYLGGIVSSLFPYIFCADTESERSIEQMTHRQFHRSQQSAGKSGENIAERNYQIYASYPDRYANERGKEVRIHAAPTATPTTREHFSRTQKNEMRLNDREKD